MASIILPLHFVKFTLFIFLVTLSINGGIIQGNEPHKKTTNETTPMHFVLVHGASFGGWCWYKVRTLLEDVGHKVTCPDLKTAGIDPTNPNTLYRFEDYNQPLHDVLASLPEGEKVILVGHSFGGFSITDAIKNFPEKIHAAIYVAAAMVNIQLPFDELVAKYIGLPIGNLDCFFEQEGSIVPIPTSCIFRKELQRDLFFNRSPLEDSTLAAMLLKPFPFRAFFTIPIFLGDLEDVPRVFIKTLDDHLFDLSNQDFMTKIWPPSKIFDIDSDHLAMVSKPLELFNLLVQVSNEFTLKSDA